ncbi:type VI secretion system baseplate subunit TssK [Archangium lansingense]|uniref:Type VI secretion system baseplate subunit TssK n=1 Tax=Archangium lansingense TaxID=2995310 RepID=A0ABT4A0H9_9BACT|nr:type VI secretion system baseplate subunit TssK [Archangium lansinium]MCY1075147.1 type VI secretion system baseplate subunit TssK [Archangium lansinium]
MQPHKLARVRWRVGQTLLPAHFQKQEQSLAAEARLQAGLSGLPQYGIASLELDKDQLKQGVFSIKAMTALTRSGFLVDVPGNATVKEYALKEAGTSEVTLYLFQSQQEPEEDDDGPLPASGVPLVVHELFISHLQTVEHARRLMTLATATIDHKRNWRLSSKKAPPLLQVGSNPLLDELLRRLDKLLSRAQGELRTFLGGAQDNLLRKDQLTNARRAYCEVRALQSLLADMEGGIHPHPYVFFNALRRLYFEICCYYQVEPDDKQMPEYRHDKPGLSLSGWMSLLDFNLKARGTQPTVKAFTFKPKEGLFLIELGEKDGMTKPLEQDFYLLIKRKEPQGGRSKEKENLKVKLASPARLADVRRLALKGIPSQHLAAPDFPHDMPLDIEWHQLKAEGKEWPHALRENGLALAFYATPALEGAEVSLFWRGK